MRNRTAGTLLAVACLIAAACGPAHAAAPVRGTDPVARSTVEDATGRADDAARAAVAVVPDELAVTAPAPLVASEPVDPYGPRCAGCPAVQPDPPRPVVERGSARVAPLVSSVRTTDPVVFLTIDDGEHWNDAAADLLAAARVPFTLFLTQDYVADKVPQMQWLARNGGWVELHTVTHPNLFRTRNDATEICGPLDAYEATYGRRSTLFRPPYGNANGTTQSVAASCGLQAVVLWRASMNYGALATQGGELRAGDIVLMHFRPDLADNLTELFRVLNENGLRLGRLECYVGGDPRCGSTWR